MIKDETMTVHKAAEVETPISDVQFLYGKIEELRKENEELKTTNTRLSREIESDSAFEIFLVKVIDMLIYYLDCERHAKTRKKQQEYNAKAEEIYQRDMDRNIDFMNRFNKIRHDYV